MSKRYREWTESYVARFAGPHATLGRCREAAEEMAATFPELRVVPGHVECPEPWGRRGHWWCETADGEIVDPTAGQFTRGILAYEPFVEGDEVRIGRCMECGAEQWGQPGESRDFCDDGCRNAFAAGMF